MLLFILWLLLIVKIFIESFHNFFFTSCPLLPIAIGTHADAFPFIASYLEDPAGTEAMREGDSGPILILSLFIAQSPLYTEPAPGDSGQEKLCISSVPGHRLGIFLCEDPGQTHLKVTLSTSVD